MRVTSLTAGSNRERWALFAHGEGLQPCDGSAEDQGVDVVSTWRRRQPISHRINRRPGGGGFYLVGLHITCGTEVNSKQFIPTSPHLRMCWQPPGSWRGGWCDTHLLCRFLPTCLWPAGRCRGLYHSCSSSAWISSLGPLCYLKNMHIFVLF